MMQMPRFADPANLVIREDPPKVTKVLELDALRYLQTGLSGTDRSRRPTDAGGNGLLAV